MKRYIFAIGFAILFLIVVLMSFNKSSIEYTNFDNALKLDKRVQVVGSWMREMPKQYDPEKNLLTFYMKDKKGKVFLVNHSGPEPNNFTLAKEFVVQGYAKNESTFIANQIITKCPSKYEGEADDLTK